MHSQSFPRILNYWKEMLIVLAILISLLAGISLIFFDAFWTPLVIVAVVAAVGIGVICMQKPVWALYLALFIVFLPSVSGEAGPTQLLSRLQSLLNRGTTMIAFISWLMSLINKKHRISLTGSALFMLGFLVWSVVTLTWAPELGSGLEKIGQYTLRFILYLVLIPNEITTRKTFDGLMRVLSVNGWILIFAGIVTLIINEYQPGGRLQVLGMDLNEFGVKLLVTSTPFLWRVLETIGSKNKTQSNRFSIFFILLAILLVAISGSRGSAVAWFATLFSFAFWKPTRKYGILMIIFLGMAILIAPAIFLTLFERFAEVSKLGALTLGGRLFIWQADWLIIQKYPLGGVGIGNAGFILATYTKIFTSLFRHLPQVQSHNAVLQIWVEVGLVGLLLYLGVLMNALLLFFQSFRHMVKTEMLFLQKYFPFVIAITVGVILWWLQGGASEHDHVYFIVLALLIIPSHLDIDTNDVTSSA